MVVGVLDHPPERLELGEDGGGELELVHQRQRLERPRPADDPAKLGELALPGGIGRPRGRRPRERCRLVVDPQLVAGADPDRAQEPQRILLEGPLGGGPQAARLGVGEPSGRVDRLAAGERDRDRVDGEVACFQVAGRSSPPGGRRRRRASPRPRSHARSRARSESAKAEPSAASAISRAACFSSPGATARSASLTGSPKEGVADRPADDPGLPG